MSSVHSIRSDIVAPISNVATAPAIHAASVRGSATTALSANG